MLQYERTVSEGIDVNKTSLSKECRLCAIIGALKMLDSNLNHMFVTNVTMY